MRQAHQRQVVEAVASHIHQRERADEREGNRDARDDRGRKAAQEQEDHRHDQRDRQHQRELHVADRRADRRGPVDDDVDLDGRRMAACSCGSSGLDPVDGFDHVGAGLLLDRENDRRACRSTSPQACSVLRPIDGLADVADAHRRAVLVGDDLVVPRLRREHLVVVVDRECACRAVDAAFRTVRRDVDDRRRADPRGRCPIAASFAGIDLDADRRLLLAEDADLGDTGNLADVLDEDVFRIVIHRRSCGSASEWTASTRIGGSAGLTFW